VYFYYCVCYAFPVVANGLCDLLFVVRGGATGMATMAMAIALFGVLMDLDVSLFATGAVHVNLNFALFCESLEDLCGLPITTFLPLSLTYYTCNQVYVA